MVPRLGTLNFVTLPNHMEIIELIINVITIVIVISKTVFFEERRNFMRELNASFICARVAFNISFRFVLLTVVLVCRLCRLGWGFRRDVVLWGLGPICEL